MVSFKTIIDDNKDAKPTICHITNKSEIRVHFWFTVRKFHIVGIRNYVFTELTLSIGCIIGRIRVDDDTHSPTFYCLLHLGTTP